MTTLPASAFISDNQRKEGEGKQFFEDILARLREHPGFEAESALIIDAGSVTAVRGTHAIDTEAAAATDDLTHIAQTNHPDGSLLLIHPADASRVVTVKHGAIGAGQIVLHGAADFVLDNPNKWLILKGTGTLWEEVTRSFGGDSVAARGFIGAAPASLLPRGHISGLVPSNNGTTSINLSAGGCRDSGETDSLTLAATITKNLSLAWAVGSLAGGLDTGAIAAGATYHQFLIKRPDTGVIDSLFSLSPTAPVMPANYTLRRRVNSFRTNGSSQISPFTCREVEGGALQYHWQDIAASDFTANNTLTYTASLLLAIRVPTGIVIEADVFATFVGDTNDRLSFGMHSPHAMDFNPTTLAADHFDDIVLGPSLVPAIGYDRQRIRTNTAAQVRFVAGGTTPPVNTLGATAWGWIDPRISGTN